MKIKQNPIKYVRIFSIIYLAATIIARIIFNSSAPLFIRSTTTAQLFQDYFGLIPMVLFVIYIFAFYGTNKTKIFLILSYITSLIICVNGLIAGIQNIISINGYYVSAIEALRYGAIHNCISTVFTAIILAFEIFYVIACISKFKQLKAAKIIIIIHTGIFILSTVSSIVFNVLGGYFTWYKTYYLINFATLFSFIAYIIFWHFAVDKIIQHSN